MTALLLALPWVAAAAPVPKDFLQESWKLDGSWKLTKYQVYGQEFEEVSLEWTINGESLVETKAGKPVGRQVIVIKTTNRTTPQHFDIQRDGSTRLGIWKIVDNKLMVCLGTDTQRPTKFEGGANVTHYTFTRQLEK